LKKCTSCCFHGVTLDFPVANSV